MQITNTSDTPDSTKSISVVDLVTITKADFNADTGMLRFDAISSDTFNDPILTAVGFGALDNSGKLEVPGLAIPPQNVTVTSARGGSATVAVVVSVAPLCYTLTVGHIGAGSNPIVAPSNSIGCGPSMYSQGENIILSGAVPSAGSLVSGWTGSNNDARTSATNTVAMPAGAHVVNIVYSDSPPTVRWLNRASVNPSGSATVNYALAFNEFVTGVDVTDFSLTLSGVSGASVASVSGSGANYTVTINTSLNSGTIRLNLADDNSIVDSAGNPLGGAGVNNFSGQTYIADKLEPTIK